MKRIPHLLFAFLLAAIGAVQVNGATLAKEDYAAYLFAYFTGNDPRQEQICFALSQDGYNYTPLNNGNPIISSDTISLKKAVRDPHILRGEDGKTFYMVVTDMRSNEGWASNDGLVLMKSNNLINWTHTAIDFPTKWPNRYDRDDLTQVWAPQTIYDPSVGKYMVYYSIGMKSQPHYMIFYSYANEDFTDLTEPELLFDLGSNTIDADIIFHDDLYHMFFKTEGEGNGIQKATAPKLQGPWTPIRQYLQQTNVAVEGSGVFKLINSNDWVLMYDCYNAGHYQFCSSSDLQNFTFQRNTATKGKFTPRHGTVIAITAEEVQRLKDRWPSAEFIDIPLDAKNPFLPGFHADPEIMYSNKTKLFYCYSTTDGFDGWGGWYYECYSSPDLMKWTYEGKVLDVASSQVGWATGNAWAPAIEEKKIGKEYRYYYYFSGHSGDKKKIGVAVSDSPTGPFVDHGSPIISDSPTGHGQQIDVDVFTDPKTGKSYIYWGNGYMAGAELEDDMTTLVPGTTKVLTPQGGTLRDYAYREAPYVFYRNGLYYFLWSVDDTGSPNYHVAYGASTSPLGPITVAKDPIVLIQDPKNGIYGTGHNSVIQIPDRDEWYIVYHRINKNFLNDAPGIHRETCIDRMCFNEDGTIKRVVPTHEGITPVRVGKIKSKK